MTGGIALGVAERPRRLGATHMSVGTGGAGLTTVDGHIERLREAREVLPK